MIPNNKNQGPYIIEFEHIGGLLSFLFDEKKVKHVENALVSNDCRAVICSSKAAMMSLQKLIPKTYLKIQKKTQVVYPSLDREVMRLSIGGKKKKSKNYRILFVGNDSYRKGFEEIIIALLRIEKSILENIVMTVISNDADEILTKYNIPKYLRIKIHKPKFTKQDIIENFYAKNDVCILPTKQDTFGYAILDSLSTGTPVISSRQFAIPEIINSGYDGILVNITRSVLDENPIYKARDAELINSSNPDPVLIDEIQKVIINTYQNRHLLLEMSLHAKEKFLKGGKFSIEKRQKLMAAIYKKALKDA
jgi:glycosyltransferase involved in cell wall biosynthesis